MASQERLGVVLDPETPSEQRRQQETVTQCWRSLKGDLFRRLTGSEILMGRRDTERANQKSVKLKALNP